MSSIKFYYKIEEDARNWERQLKKRNFSLSQKDRYSYHSELLFLAKKNKQNLRLFMKDYLTSKKDWNKIVQYEIRLMREVWPLYEGRIFSLIAKTLEKPLLDVDFKVSMTTCYVCPYDARHNWFMVSFLAGLPQQITNITHELFHLYLIRYYGDYFIDKNISQKKLTELYEILTVILNSKEFQKILLVPDKGYEEHKEIREKVLFFWEKRKNFKQFIDRVCNI